MRRLLLLLCCLASALPARAGDALAAAEAALKARWPDARISASAESLPVCAGSISAEPPGALRDGIAQLRLRCEAQPGWTRYVRLGVERPGTVWVLTQPLERGAVVNAAVLKSEPRDLARLPYLPLTDAAAIAGHSARRTLPAGTVLSAALLQAPPAIRRGETVTLVGLAAGLEVMAPGEALADAADGQRLKVRNRGSRRVVEGIARSGQRVEVAP